MSTRGSSSIRTRVHTPSDSVTGDAPAETVVPEDNEPARTPRHLIYSRHGPAACKQDHPRLADVKGTILAGDTLSRLRPITRGSRKHLPPVHGEPWIRALLPVRGHRIAWRPGNDWTREATVAPAKLNYEAYLGFLQEAA